MLVEWTYVFADRDFRILTFLSSAGRTRISLAIAMLLSNLFIGGPVSAQNGPCSFNAGPAIFVKVVGLKHRSGTVRIRLFGGNPSTYFDKRYALKRIEFAPPKSGDIEYCMPIPRPGVYVVDVRHDANGSGKTDKADGAGVSGNPDVSLLDVVLKKKPSARKVHIAVGGTVSVTTIIVKYLSGGKFKPA
jgi:uncharacterized protein (DUF2141 family)